ncbi:MAG: rod shape-determining protein MreC [Patescibacteria group bacterium]
MAITTGNLRLRFIVITTVVVFVIIILHLGGVLKPVENSILILLSPVQRAFYHLGLEVFDPDNSLDPGQLKAKNEELEEKIAELTIENTRLLSAVANSAIIEQELDFLSEKQTRGLIAHIISKSADGFENVVVIDKGSSDRIEPGLPVVANEGIIVGKILSVTANSAKVLLLTDGQSRLAASIQNENRSPGVAIGQHGLTLEMELIPQDEEISINQIVITSGAEENIPADLVIGTIDSIHSGKEELFQSASISLIIPYNRLTIVMVLLPDNE